MTDEQAKKLEYPFTFDEIEWRVLRVSKKKPVAQVAAYVDSRAIQNRLDSVIGRENWQNRFTTVSGSNNDGTTHICEISIYYKERGEWITKSDGAGCTDVEPIKGGLSNAFKRAASMWGMGRYLYELKNIWAEIDEYKCIAQNVYPELERKYNQFVNKYLQSKFGTVKATPSDQNQQSPQTVTSKSVQQQTVPVSRQAPPPQQNIPNGRFTGTPVQNPMKNPVTSKQPQNNGCRILNLQVTKGAKSSQTLITFENPQGDKVTGYIQGKPDLKQGQYIFNPKITTKNNPLVGDYNIIESYNLAA